MDVRYVPLFLQALGHLARIIDSKTARGEITAAQAHANDGFRAEFIPHRRGDLAEEQGSVLSVLVLSPVCMGA